MSVTPFPAAAVTPSAGTLETLAATLAFERLVDLLASFQQQRGALPAGDVSPLERARLRATLQQTLNELDPAVSGAAELRCASFLARALPGMRMAAEAESIDAAVIAALGDYRRGLRQVPLRGVGELV